MRKKRSGEDSLLYLNTGGARSLEGKRCDPCFSNECKKSIDRKRTKCYNYLRCRGIAQFGSALGSGPRGRRFKSCCSDHLCGCSSMVERQPSKLVTRVRFSSPAPFFYPLSERIFYWEKISHGEQQKEEFWLSKLCIQVQTWMHSFLLQVRAAAQRFAKTIWITGGEARKIIRYKEQMVLWKEE